MYHPFFLNDPIFLLLIPALLLSFWAQARVTGSFRKWSKKQNSQHLTGAQVAKNILASHGLSKVTVHAISGEITDNYDPVHKKLNLSKAVHDTDSIAAVGIAAHEAGHAIQHGTGYKPLTLRNGIYPVANLGSRLAMPLFFLGLFMGYNRLLMNAGIALFVGALVFTLLLLPVEFNASRRAMAILEHSGYLSHQELAGAREVLSAAALTYVAAALMALLNLVRLLVLSRGRD